ncbi:hypothetical protein GW17_00045220 [Ensete ventricosum]|nr:hypothetical protein GW17_00045220 [Ensete ventricosum]
MPSRRRRCKWFRLRGWSLLRVDLVHSHGNSLRYDMRVAAFGWARPFKLFLANVQARYPFAKGGDACYLLPGRGAHISLCRASRSHRSQQLPHPLLSSWPLTLTTNWVDLRVRGRMGEFQLVGWESRKWDDWELPCYVTSFLTIVILGVGLNAKAELTLETWAHQKALERLQQQQIAPDSE